MLQLKGGEVHFQFEALNTGKKGIALDLRQESGRDILYKLVQKSDIFISNYELGALKKLKADYQTLSQFNPKLIYAVLSGYGSVGPDKDERGFDISAGWARSGAQYHVGNGTGRDPPTATPRSNGYDRFNAYSCGILAALLHRERQAKDRRWNCPCTILLYGVYWRYTGCTNGLS